MGFYLRKSIRVGPLRFNISNSGIGVSAGIPGFRVGTGPRGNYVHVGAGGLYYRTTIPTPSRSPAQRQVSRPAEQPSTHSVLELIGSSCVSQMVDATSSGLLSELNEKQKRSRIWPLVAVLSLIFTGTIAGLVPSFWVVLSAAILSLTVVLATYQFDELRKTVVVLYDLDSKTQTAYELVHTCVAQLASCGGKWHVNARGQVLDPKYHGGAGSLISGIESHHHRTSAVRQDQY